MSFMSMEFCYQSLMRKFGPGITTSASIASVNHQLPGQTGATISKEVSPLI